MIDRDRLRRQLTRHEGMKLKPYIDTVGKITIGCGRNLTDKGISQAEADLLLDNDMDECLADCATFPWFASLNGVRQRAILDLRFNLGAAGLRAFKRTLAAMARGDFIAAAAHLADSKWFRQVGVRGPRIVAMLRTGRDE